MSCIVLLLSLTVSSAFYINSNNNATIAVENTTDCGEACSNTTEALQTRPKSSQEKEPKQETGKLETLSDIPKDFFPLPMETIRWNLPGRVEDCESMNISMVKNPAKPVLGPVKPDFFLDSPMVGHCPFDLELLHNAEAIPQWYMQIKCRCEKTKSLCGDLPFYYCTEIQRQVPITIQGNVIKQWLTVSCMCIYHKPTSALEPIQPVLQL